jgi:bacterioferritin-associated ferredoxin
MVEKIFKAELNGRDLIEIDLSSGKARTRVVGCPEFLTLMRKYQVQFGNNPELWPFPQGTSHGELLLKEVLMKMRGEWIYPYADLEICHCRAVPTEVVDQAIIAGAHNNTTVSRRTSASTACGTCRDDVKKIIDFRLKKTS